MSLISRDPLPRLSVILGTNTIFVLKPEESDVEYIWEALFPGQRGLRKRTHTS